MPGQDVLIVGGYGTVGRRIANRLAPLFPDRVVIAGRSEARAQALCRELGHGTRAVRIDVDDAASIGPALHGVGTVMACVAQQDLHLLREAISRGLAYTDIAPRLAFWRGAEKMAAEARESGARVVLGAGLSPGISNMMAAKLAKHLGGIDTIETAIVLSLGDEYGPDSVHHMFEAVAQPFSVLRNGKLEETAPFSGARPILFPEPFGERTAYLFPWSDAVYYPTTLGARTSLGRFALEPAWANQLVALLVRLARSWLSNPGFVSGNRRVIDRLKRRYAESDRFALAVTATEGTRTAKVTLASRRQANVTAAAAAEFVRSLVAGEVEAPGVWLPEQVIDPDRFFKALEDLGWTTALVETKP